MTAFLRFALFLLILCAVTEVRYASAQTTPTAGEGVTVQRERVRLYDLLREVNEQTVRAAQGKPMVTLRVDPDDAAAATPMAVFVKGLSLPAFADALTATLTVRKAAWRWIPGDAPPSKDDDAKAVKPEDFKPGQAYTLRPNAAARTYAARTRAQILDDLTAEAQGVAEGRIALPKETPPAVAPANASAELNESIRQVNETIKKEAAQRKAAFPGFARLTAAQRESLIGGAEITMELSELPADAATLLQESLTAGASPLRTQVLDDKGQPILGLDGQAQTVELVPNGPPHVYLRFSLTRRGLNLAPRLTTSGYAETDYGKPGSENSSRAISATEILQIGAATEARWRDRWSREWQDTPPATPPAQDALLLTNPRRSASNPKGVSIFTEGRDVLTGSLRLLADAGNFPLIVRLPASSWDAAFTFHGEGIPLSKARDLLLRQSNVVTRWRVTAGGGKESVLIGVAPSFVWDAAPEHLVSPAYREALIHAAEEDPIGCLPLDSLLDAAKRLSPEALKSLEPNFPQSMETVANWRPLFKAIAENGTLRRQIVTKQGVVLDNFPSLVSAFQANMAMRYVFHNITGTPLNQPAPNIPPGTHFRLTVKDYPGNRTISLETFDANPKEVSGQGFDLLPVVTRRAALKQNATP